MPAKADVSFRSVSKRYLIRQNARNAAEEKGGSRWLGRLRRKREPRHEFWAVNDVSFEVERGESLGIIGHNGAGKSTVLKMLAGITAPTRGEISIRGRLSALLEVGSGFHPELTGRENVYLSGSVLGMQRREIQRKMDSIIDFAGVERFIDTPVKRYSSGMYVRLGFSIAAHLEPDVLLLDEVLAVGDKEFRDRCKERIDKLHAGGTTIVFISHDLGAVQNLCQRVLLLERGRVAAQGAPQEVIQRYTETSGLSNVPLAEGGARQVQVTDVAFFDESGERATGFRTGFPITARVEYYATEEIPDASISLMFLWAQGWTAAQWTTAGKGRRLVIQPGHGSIEFRCEELGLQPNVFRIDALIERPGANQLLDHQEGCTSIYVKPGKKVRGTFYSPHRWHEIVSD